MYNTTPPEIRDLDRYARCMFPHGAGDAPRLHTQIIDEVILVWLPYELKESYKQWFPGAAWLPVPRCWTAGLHQRERLELWMQTVRDSGVLDDLAARRARAIDDAELRRLAEELAELRRQIAASLESAIPELRRRALGALRRELAAVRAADDLREEYDREVEW
jgi:hypothetical protein